MKIFLTIVVIGAILILWALYEIIAAQSYEGDNF